jgi:hypothetical protein
VSGPVSSRRRVTTSSTPLGLRTSGALVRAAQQVRLTRPIGEQVVTLAFGGQLRVDPLDAANAPRLASYGAKYATKGVEHSGVLDRRLREDQLEQLQLPEHLRRLVATAFALAKDPRHARCARWAHALGWSGHVLTKSRRWSTTFCALRRARREWRAAEAGEAPAAGTTTWSFEGVGHRFEIDRMLARGVEEQVREARFESWLERREAG